MGRALTLVLILVVCIPAFAQAPAATSADATKRADSYVTKMSPEQKIDYVDLAEKVGAGIGKDVRARGIHFMLGPSVNIYRASSNGRNFEYFGEDPFLRSPLGEVRSKGVQLRNSLRSFEQERVL